jgi:hypothetical protein
MEGLQDMLFKHFPDFPAPSSIDNLLVLISPNLRAEAYVNELTPTGTVFVTHAVEKDAQVKFEDLATIETLDLGVEVPEDHGFVLMLSHGWRKVVMFDFAPLLLPPLTREYDCPTAFGTIYTHLLFLEQLRITDEAWEHMFERGWFPFRFLPHRSLQRLIRLASSKRELDECVDDKAIAAIAERASSTDLFSAAPFSLHRSLIEHAMARFKDGDYVSTVSILYPRIEGILRSMLHAKGLAAGRLKGIINDGAAEVEKSAPADSLLLPHRFAVFTRTVLFREWSQSASASHISRHTVSHGVAPQEHFNRNAAVVAVLSLLQLGLYLKRGSTKPEDG